MKKITSFLLSALLLINISGINAAAATEIEEISAPLDLEYYERFMGENVSINVYNWGEYISDGSDDTLDINKAFEELTGITVNYSNFATNEEMYTKIKGSNASYDVIIPSDYMIARMIEEDMLEPLNHENMPALSNIMENFTDLDYDPGNLFSIPYVWSMVVIFYNTTMVDEEVDSWGIFWDEQYENEILMFSNSRDAFGIAQKYLGYSYNSTDKAEWQASLELMKEGKGLVHAYVMDEIFDKMAGGEAAIAPYYAGDGKLLMEDNPDISYAVPKEGTNLFVDALCIPKGSAQKEAAEMYINFMTEAEVALATTEFIGYPTANAAAFELLSDDIKENKLFYPSDEVLENTEQYLNMAPEMNEYIQSLWEELKSFTPGGGDQNEGLTAALLVLAVVGASSLNILRRRRKRKREEY